jgi:FkbM family methyltransferase
MQPVIVNLNISNRQLVMTFDQESPVHRSMLAELQSNGGYEIASQLFMTRVLREGDTFVDVGAHIGYFTMLAAATVGEQGMVIAVEPMDENHQQLCDHIATNNLGQVQIVKTVIRDSDGEAEIHFNSDNDGGHALWNPGEHPANELSRQNPRSNMVPSCKFSTLLANSDVEHVRLLKIDTEGAEAMILESSREVFAAGRVDFAVIEVNISGLRNLGSDIPSLFALARELGFILCLPQDNGTPPVLLAADNEPDPRSVYNVILARPEALATL